MKRSKRTISALLCLVMALSLVLTGCGEDDGGKQPTGSEFVYVPKYTRAQQSFNDGVYNATFADGYYYFISRVMPEGTVEQPDAAVPEIAVSESEVAGADGLLEEPVVDAVEPIFDWSLSEERLFKMDLEGNVTELSGYKVEKLPEGVDGYIGTNGIDVDDEGNVYVLVNKSLNQFDLPEGFDESTGDKWEYYVGSTSEYQLKKVSADGATVENVDLGAMGIKENEYLNRFVVSGEYIYVTLDQRVCVLDMNGALVYTYESENWVDTMLKLPDGSVAISVYEDTNKLYRLDPVAKKAEVYCEELPSGAWNLQTGSGEYAAFYTNGANLYGLKIADGVATEEKVLNWINCDIDSDQVRSFAVQEDGTIVGLIIDWSGEEAVVEMVTLTKTPAKDVEQKETLTLAIQYLDWETKGAVLKFNRNNPDYRIEILDYSEYNTEENYEAGLQKLTTEILSGNMPDIVYTSGLPIDQMAAKGLLEDLYPYMENDGEVTPNDLIPAVRAALEMDGKLYRTAQTFSIVTVMGNREIVGEDMGWTMDEFRTAYASMPAGCDIFSMGTTRANILEFMLMMNESQFVDWATGECHFDSQEFIDLLDFIKLFPENFNWDANTEYESDQSRIATGKQMLMETNLGDFYDFQYNMSAFGDKGVFVGFPTSEGVGNALMLGSGYAISSKCANKDAAWQFVRQFMTADGQERIGWGFPTNQKAFDARLKEAMTPNYRTDENGNYVLDENGNKIEESKGGWSDGVNSYEFYAMTQEQADQLMDLVESCTRVVSESTSVYDIVNEEAQAYFNGQKSAEDTAKMVQSRVSIYVKEQS